LPRKRHSKTPPHFADLGRTSCGSPSAYMPPQSPYPGQKKIWLKYELTGCKISINRRFMLSGTTGQGILVNMMKLQKKNMKTV
jgi:hypothetical protein